VKKKRGLRGPFFFDIQGFFWYSMNVGEFINNPILSQEKF